MNLELIRLKKKLAVMETEGSNQVFMDLLKEATNTDIEITNLFFDFTIKRLKNKYQKEIDKLEKQETKYKQGQLL